MSSGPIAASIAAWSAAGSRSSRSASQAVRLLADRAYDAVPLVGQEDADAAAIDGALAPDQPGRLEPVEVRRHAGCGDPLALGQLPCGDAGLLLGCPEQRELPAVTPSTWLSRRTWRASRRSTGRSSFASESESLTT